MTWSLCSLMGPSDVKLIHRGKPQNLETAFTSARYLFKQNLEKPPRRVSFLHLPDLPGPCLSDYEAKHSSAYRSRNSLPVTASSTAFDRVNFQNSRVPVFNYRLWLVMSNSTRRECTDELSGRLEEDEFDDSSSISSGVETSTVRSGSISGGRSNIGLVERLTEVLVDDGEGDLLLQRSDREDRVLMWLQALDIHVMGACRADERLKPLLKLNASSGVAEDRLLAHLSQHFDPFEIGMLTRCFCIPLVSIRVAKINKRGNLLCPTSARGNMNLAVLPTSDLRLSFIGDDGTTERLFTLSGKSHVSAVVIKEIPTDSSGRSFQIKVPGGVDYYYWCSEKSKLLGIELIAKMKDILKRKPSIAELTGISKSRLDCFADHIRADLVGFSSKESAATLSSSFSSSPDGLSAPTSSLPTKPLHSRNRGGQVLEGNTHYQGNLGTESSSFKDVQARSLSSLWQCHGESDSSALDNLEVTLRSSIDSENGKSSLVKGYPAGPSSGVVGSLDKLAIPVPPVQSSTSPVPSLISPVFSPYYSWCPLGGSSAQYPSESPNFVPLSLMQTSLLPPLSSLLSASSSVLTPLPHLDLPDVQSLDLPAVLPESLVPFPIPCSQQIPTFNSLICDPIVHVPVIDVCSSGPGFLVNAAPMKPFSSKLLNTMTSGTESTLEAGARETLRLLISSSTSTSSQLESVFPDLYGSGDDKKAGGIFAVGSRGLYTESRDIGAIASNMATLGLISLSQTTMGNGVGVGVAAEQKDACEKFEVFPRESNGMDGDEISPYSNMGGDV